MKLTFEEKLQDIKDHPDKHHHRSLHELNACATVGKAIDLALIDAHGQYAPVGYNGGQPCDVTRGPCSCGAWH